MLLWLDVECELGPLENEDPALEDLPELYELRDDRELEDRLEEREKLEDLEELECEERELELCLLGGIVFSPLLIHWAVHEALRLFIFVNKPVSFIAF